MGLFDKLFGKKQAPDQAEDLTKALLLQKGDTILSTGDNEGFKITRPLTTEQKERIEKSTLPLRTGQLYMHYWTDYLVCNDRNDQEWQNKVLFFWRAEEPFPKKSLPPVFETFKRKYFLFLGDTSRISLQMGTAMPWFGMPGLGEKYFCKIYEEKMTVPELAQLGSVEYVEPIELTNDNLNILTDKENYLFLIDERITTFQNGSFYLKGRSVTIDMAYSIGGIHIIKKTGLQ